MDDNIIYEPEFLHLLKERGSFKVPELYFEEFLERNEKISQFGYLESDLKSQDFQNCPKDYFKELPDLILEKVRIDHVLPHQDNSKFQIPQGYFQNLSDEVLGQIKHDQTLAPKKYFRSSWLYAVAAMFVLAVSLVVLNYQNNQLDKNLDLSKIDEEVLMEFAYENAGDMDSESLANLLDEDELYEMDLQIELGGNDLDEMIEFYQ
ncbi:MAG: hypothetical protein JNK69_08565 [Saprospiraceae bacterium]|nr:hypothetical protein [Candidatus Vicinibacter proximus]MBL7823447.1 hypothetical protein [Saprospiraceae bacterium]MCC6842478.1 hypothetical protein [Saprospiraceae bacterium]HRG32210.1 hypothetical protein [Saprospiraceae bacterium]